MLLFNGEPAEVFPVHCEVLMPLEIWTYPGTERIRGSFTLVFIAYGRSNFKLWSPNDDLSPLLSADMRVPVDNPARGYQAIGELCYAGGGHLFPLGGGPWTGGGWKPPRSSSPSRARSGFPPSLPMGRTSPRAPSPSRPR